MTEHITMTIAITIVFLIVISRLPRDILSTCIKDHSQPNLLLFVLQLSTRKVVSLSRVDCWFQALLLIFIFIAYFNSHGKKLSQLTFGNYNEFLML